MKRLWLLLVVLCVVGVVGCSDKDASGDNNEEDRIANVNTDSELPIVHEPIELDVFVRQAVSSTDDYDDVMIYNEYEERSNVKINWDQIPAEGLTEKRNLALGSDNLPEIFHSTNMPDMDLLKYGEQGTFLKLNDLIDEYAPNLKKIFDEHPDVKAAVTMPDGNIYSMPRLYEPEYTTLLLGDRPFVRGDWLEQLGMDNPTTTDELYDYLTAVKETDLLGDGSGDEVPFGGTSINRLTNWLTGAFGVMNHGSKNKYIDLDPETEELRFYPISDQYKEMLEYVHKLYDEKLIQQNIYSIETSQFHATGSEGLYGSTYHYSPDKIFSGEGGQNFIGGEALEGPNGDRSFPHVGHPVVTLGSFILTKENKNPEASVKWMDYFYGDEGAKLFFMGIEDETFIEKDDGTFEYMDHILNSKEGLSMDQEISKYLTFPGGGYPGYVKEAFYNGSEDSELSRDASENIEPYIPDEIWPRFTYTEDENKHISTIGADLEKYVKEMTDKFIVGDESFDNWDKYVEEVERIGLEDHMEVKEAAYERYLEAE